MHKAVTAMLASALLLAGCSTPADRLEPIAANPVNAYRMGAGDEVRITVAELEQLNNSYLVGDTGTISLPLLPPIGASGRTVSQLQDELARSIVARKLVLDPNVSVQVQRYRPFFILGEVQRPGQYPYVPGTTVLAAVSIAGGFTFRADVHSVSISRQPDPAAAAVVKGRGGQDTRIEPGDTIYVHEGWF